MSMTNLKKMIWFLDPIDHKEDLNVSELQAIGQWAERNGIEVIPFFALTPRVVNWIGLGDKPILQNFVPVIESQMQACLDEVQASAITQPVVFISEEISERDVMTEVKSFCEENEVGSVLVFSSKKSGLERFFKGSFSDTLLFSLNLPSFVLPLDVEKIDLTSPILVPFDLSKENAEAIHTFFNSQPPLPKSKIVLYHKITRPDEAFIQTGVHFAGGAWLSMEDFHANQMEQCKNRCDDLQKSLAGLGYEVETFLDSAFGAVDEGIRDYCQKERVGVTLLFTNASPATALLLGSLTRQLLRNPPTPLWVLHS